MVFSSCNWFKGNKDKEYIERLENTIHDDSLEFAAQVEKLKKESEAKIDSIKNSCGGANGTYHVITGSFRNPSNAENYKIEMSKLGYTANIVMAPNGFNLVTTFSGNDFKEACNALANIRNSVNPESWIYVKQ